jgi:hypothetical protein
MKISGKPVSTVIKLNLLSLNLLKPENEKRYFRRNNSKNEVHPAKILVWVGSF